jgi:hypothetical protein
MNYVQEVQEALAAKLGLDPELRKLYALLVLVKGEETSLEDVHDAWSIWCNIDRPTHRSLIPFDQLTPKVQELDRLYMEVIHEVSREIKWKK